MNMSKKERFKERKGLREKKEGHLGKGKEVEEKMDK